MILFYTCTAISIDSKFVQACCARIGSILYLEPLSVVADKSPLMNEFLSQIKSNPELAAMFESIQKDATTTASETSLMDIS